MEQIEPVGAEINDHKYIVLPSHSAADEWKELDRVYVLEIEPTQSCIIEKLEGVDAAHALVQQTYQFDFISKTCRFGEHLLLVRAASIKNPRLLRASAGAADRNSSASAHDPGALGA